MLRGSTGVTQSELGVKIWFFCKCLIGDTNRAKLSEDLFFPLFALNPKGEIVVWLRSTSFRFCSVPGLKISFKHCTKLWQPNEPDRIRSLDRDTTSLIHEIPLKLTATELNEKDWIERIAPLFCSDDDDWLTISWQIHVLHDAPFI